MLEIGASDAIRELAGKGTEVVDLRGRFVSPGFIDAHLHLLGGGWSLEELRLDDASDFATLQARVRAWAQANPEARWVTGEGWSYGAFPNGMPTRLQLDALVPDRPALLGSYDGHTGWANSAALRLAEITRATKDPAGGEIARDAAGEPTGVLKESAQRLVERLLPKRLPHENERAFRNAIAQAASWGLTGVHQAGISEEELESLSHALAGLAAAARLRRAADGARSDARAARAAAGAAPALFRPAPADRRGEGLRRRRRRVADRRDVRALRRRAARAAANWTQDELDRAVAAYDKAGFQVMLHAIGDRGDRHGAHRVRARRARRTARAGAGTASSTSRCRGSRTWRASRPRAWSPRRRPPSPTRTTTTWTSTCPTLGPERAHRALAYKAIDDAGAVQAFGSDWPVFSADVVRGLATVVTRTTDQGTPAGGWEPQQRLSVEAALRHFTGRRLRRGRGAGARHARQGQGRRLRRAVAGPAHGRARADQGRQGAADRARRPEQLPRRRVLMAVYAGKVVIVTGASQGIGRALSLELAPQRPRLVLAARDTGGARRRRRRTARRAGPRRSSSAAT